MRTTFFFAGLVGALVGQSEAINLGAESVSDLTTMGDAMGDAPVDLDTYLEANAGADNELDAGSESEGGDDKSKDKP